MWEKERQERTFYRSASEIRSDMRHIAEQIRETDEKLNIRDLLVESVYESGCGAPALITRLGGLVREAHRARDELCLLEEKLMLLQDELEEVRCLGCR